MTRQNFVEIKPKIGQFQYTSLSYAVFEDLPTYEILRNNGEAILIRCENPGALMRELHFAVNDPQLVIEAAAALPAPVLVTFVPTEHKRLFLENGFEVYGEMQDYWVEGFWLRYEQN
ncbi:MAG: hypothetical protein FWF44_08420 [Defluviitaleaceae bacterium]|nr:hypothetical protein [Defluviitaleaceae bacterium]